jgi:hypothetical protein
MDFGSHRILTGEQRRVRFRYADEVLYAIGMYLMSLEPPKNPNPAAAGVLARGLTAYLDSSGQDLAAPKSSGNLLGTFPYWVAAVPSLSIKLSLTGEPSGHRAQKSFDGSGCVGGRTSAACS